MQLSDDTCSRAPYLLVPTRLSTKGVRLYPRPGNYILPLQLQRLSARSRSGNTRSPSSYLRLALTFRLYQEVLVPLPAETKANATLSRLSGWNNLPEALCRRSKADIANARPCRVWSSSRRQAAAAADIARDRLRTTTGQLHLLLRRLSPRPRTFRVIHQEALTGLSLLP